MPDAVVNEAQPPQQRKRLKSVMAATSSKPNKISEPGDVGGSAVKSKKNRTVSSGSKKQSSSQEKM